MLVSVIVPTLNEAANIRASLRAARNGYAPAEVEIIISDGGSTDNTLSLLPDDIVWVRSPRGRGVQMNRGAAVAHGDILLFCHSDTRLPEGWRAAVINVLADPQISGGGFQRLFEPAKGFVHVINRIKIRDNWRLLHGDRAQFMRRETFDDIGGFPEIPLMEDVEMARALHERGEVKIVPFPLQVVSSSRRLLERGAFRQYCLTGWCRFRYFHLGATPEDIARVYRSSREDALSGRGEKPPQPPPDGVGRMSGMAILLLLISFLAPLMWPLLSKIITIDAQQARAFIEATGPWAPLVYSLAYAVSSPVPGIAPLLSPMAGYLFGLTKGLALVLVVATVTALIPFTLARKLGRGWVEKRVKGKKLEAAYARSEDQIGFIFVLFLRLVPVLPWEVQNYVAGLTKISIRSFLLATALGILPGSTAFVLLGEAVADGSPWKSTLAIVLDTSVILVASVIAGIVYRKNARRPTRSETGPDAPMISDNHAR